MNGQAIRQSSETAPHTCKPRVLPKWLPAVCLLVIFALAFAIRLDAGLRKELVGTDEARFLIAGRNFWRGKGLVVAPGQPYTHSPALQGIVAAGIGKAIGTADLQVANAIAFAVFGALGAVMVFVLAWRLFGEKTGLLTAALYSVLPTLSVKVHYWNSTTETLLLALVLAGCYGYLRYYEGKPLAWVGAGAAAFGVAAMARMDGFVYLAVMTSLLALRKTFARPGWFRPMLAPVLCSVLAFAAAYAPYGVMLWRCSGRFIPSVAGHTAAAYNPLRLSEDDLYAETMDAEESDTSFVRYALREWPKYPRRMAANLWIAFSRETPDVVPFYLFPFVGLALFADSETWRDRWRILFLAATALPLMAYMLFYVQARFLVVVLPALLILAARGLLSVPWRSGATRPALCVVVIVMLIGEGRNQAHALAMEAAHPEFRAAGKWIAAHSAESEFIMTRKPEVAYYADRPRARLPWTESIAELHAAALRAGVNCVVFDEKRSLPVRLPLKPLLDVEAMQDDPWFEVFHASTEKGHRLVVLKPRQQAAAN